MRRLFVMLTVLAACGGDGSPAAPDAQVTPMIDAAPVYPACHEFADPPSSLPAHVTSNLAAADVQSPMQCTTVDAPYGIASAGPDSVVPLTGLVPGTPYIVLLRSNADLAFYVVSGCSTATGPSQSECALFVDASADNEEVGRFIADATTAYVVVDYYASATPATQRYTLDVYAEACNDDSACSGSAAVCYHGRCVECADSFDCPGTALPRCEENTNTCATGADACLTDDASEPVDDGPAGAVALVPDGVGAASASGQICSTPRSEVDYFKFTVGTVGETWDFDLAWTGTRDLDLEVLSATGDMFALSFWEQPEKSRLTYLPVGTYYVRISDFSTATTTAVAYTLTAQRTLGTGCTNRADCATEYRNQPFRGDCTAGACVAITAVDVPLGGACDTEDDCAASLACPDFYFIANADTRSVCSPSCTTDAECATAGPDYVCTTYLPSSNFCIQQCTTDDQCPTDPSSQPLSGPWYRLTCQTSTGRCIFQ